MIRVQVKRVYDAAEPQDGMRLLVDRLWPRGLTKEAVACDLWVKDIAPSNELRNYFHANMEEHWESFALRYQEELAHSPALVSLVERLKQEKVEAVTLLYASRAPLKNHALILQEMMQKMLQA